MSDLVIGREILKKKIRFFDIPSTTTDYNIKTMAGSIRTFTIDFPYYKSLAFKIHANTQLD
jgi:hypothetical protein